MSSRTIASTTAGAVLALGIAACGASHHAAATTTRTRASRSPHVGLQPTAHRTGQVYKWGMYGGQGHHGRVTTMVGAGQQGGGAGMRSHPMPIAGIIGHVRQIAASNSDGYALTTSGAVYAWGVGADGELGDGTPTGLSPTAVRVSFPAGVTIASLPNPMPFDGGMAIDTQGNVWAWGNDENQEFCLPTPGVLDTPVKVPLSDVTLAVGAARHATYDAGGRIVSCGLGEYGQLGNGSAGVASQTASPVAVRGLPAGRVVALTASYGDAGALMASGAYYDWGLNTGGQVGDGATAERRTAVHVRLPGKVRSVFQGGSLTDNGQSVALLGNGQLWEWGSGTFGQLGNGATADRSQPFRLKEPHGVHFVSVTSGGATDFAIDRSGRVWAWGSDAGGDLGDGQAVPDRATPVRLRIRALQVASTAQTVISLVRR